jgi:hypothetical protein
MRSVPPVVAVQMRTIAPGTGLVQQDVALAAVGPRLDAHQVRQRVGDEVVVREPRVAVLAPARAPVRARRLAGRERRRRQPRQMVEIDHLAQQRQHADLTGLGRCFGSGRAGR